MATAEQIQQAKNIKQEPPVTKKLMFRKFKGFTPVQQAMLLGNTPADTPEGAKKLVEATSKAQDQINKMYNGGVIQANDGLYIKKQSKNRGDDKRINITPAKMQEIKDLGINPADLGIRESKQGMGFTSWTGSASSRSATLSKIRTAVSDAEAKQEEEATVVEEEETDGGSGGEEGSDSSGTPAEAPINALDYTQGILTGEQGLNPDATAEAINISDAEVAAGNVASAGLTQPDPTVTATVTPVATAATPTAQEAVQIKDPTLTQEAIDEAAKVDEARGILDAQSQVEAQTMDASDLSALDLEAAQIADEDKTQVKAVDPRVEQDKEMISKYDADASTAAEFAEEVEAAQGEVSTLSTVKGQLAELQKEFDNDEIPMWAAGAYRQATQAIAARGLSSSSIAGQAIVHALMESSIPIAAADAKVYQEMDLANLSNRQQRAMLAAQQRATFIGQEFDQAFQMRVINASKVSDIANMNFSAEQQVALENARLTQTVNLANLSNRQAKIMADAASMTQIEMINLNNRQQAAVANAQAFLQMDMTNLAFEQQSAMFEAQSRVQSLFTDAAAENAAKNINAQSSNDMNKFFAGLINNTDIQNASSINGMAQFNTNAVNSIAQFNSQMINQREMWNAENARIIAESNANWRRAVTTTNNATQNAVNQMNAQNSLGLQTQAYSNLWQRDRDIMNMTYQTQQMIEQQAHEIVIAKMGQAAAKSEAGGLLTGAIINGIFDNYTSIFGGGASSVIKAVTG